MSNCVKGECFSNVEKNLNSGDSGVLGWVIWQTSTHLLQAEFHSVILRSNGDLGCVTPFNRPYSKILFLPHFDFLYKQKRVQTRYKAISDAKETTPFIDALEAIAILEEELSSKEAREYINLPENQTQRETLIKTIHKMETAVENFEKMVLKNTGPNSPCICESGLKFKKCCGKYC